ncbi:MAG: hypothetical protein ACTSYR_03000 [Candidatus Odinarchaeia archaeon]
MGIESINSFRVYQQIINLKFTQKAANKLRIYLNILKNNSSKTNLDVFFIRYIEAFLVFLSKIFSQKKGHVNIFVEDVERVISFFNYYTENKLWNSLLNDNKKIFIHSKAITEVELNKAYFINFPPKARLSFKETFNKFSEYICQVFDYDPNLGNENKKEKFKKLLEYSFMTLVRLLAISNYQDKVYPETVKNSQYIIKKLIFRIDEDDIDFPFNFKKFITRERFLRILEYFTFFEKKPSVYALLKDTALSFTVKKENTDIISNYLKDFVNMVYLIFILLKYRKWEFKVSNSEIIELNKIITEMIKNLTKKHDLTLDDKFLKEVNNVELPIYVKLNLSDLSSLIIGFQNEVNITEELKFYLNDLARKFSNLVGYLSKLIAFGNNKRSVSMKNLKTGFNKLVQLLFNHNLP